jgi:hypothetical protein
MVGLVLRRVCWRHKPCPSHRTSRGGVRRSRVQC